MTISIGAIDDDVSILYTLEAMAQSAGWQIKTSTDWRKAIAWVERNETDILLLDYHMPEINGLDLLKKIRDISRSVTILVLTVEESPTLAQELLISGADDFISKPIRLADFTSRIALHSKLAQYRRLPGLEGPHKGISHDTMRLVISTLEAITPDKATIHDVSERTGLSYQTSHRYLEYLASAGVVSKEPLYQDGRPGRPKYLYFIPQRDQS